MATDPVASTVHAVRLALRAALLADGGAPLAGVRVSYGPPLPSPPAEYVWLGRATARETAVALGNRRRDEEYALDVHVSCLRAGQDSAGAAERAHEIVAAIAGVLRVSPQLAGHYGGGGQIIAATFGGVTEDDPRANSTHVEHAITCAVDVRART